jgi:hypothetical protein
MPSLHDIQADFSRALLGGSEQAIIDAVLGDRLAPGQRVQIYRNHLRISLREALGATFPVIQRLVGDDYFAAVARGFIERYPPRSPVLADYGAAFPAFLAEAPNAPPYLADVARLEWALNLAFNAADHQPLAAADLAGLAPEAQAALALRPLPSSFIVDSAFPILAIWHANQPGRDATVDLAQGGQRVLVWREDGDSVCRALSDGEHELLQALFGGATFADAVARALAAEPDLDFARLIASLLATPIFAKI